MKIDDLKIRASSDGLNIEVVDPRAKHIEPLISTKWWGFHIPIKPTRGQAKAIIGRLVNCYNEKYGTDE